MRGSYEKRRTGGKGTALIFFLRVNTSPRPYPYNMEGGERGYAAPFPPCVNAFPHDSEIAKRSHGSVPNGQITSATP